MTIITYLGCDKTTLGKFLKRQPSATESVYSRDVRHRSRKLTNYFCRSTKALFWMQVVAIRDERRVVISTLEELFTNYATYVDSKGRQLCTSLADWCFPIKSAHNVMFSKQVIVKPRRASGWLQHGRATLHEIKPDDYKQ